MSTKEVTMNVLEFRTEPVAYGPTMSEHMDDNLGDHFLNSPSLQMTYLGSALKYLPVWRAVQEGTIW